MIYQILSPFSCITAARKSSGPGCRPALLPRLQGLCRRLRPHPPPHADPVFDHCDRLPLDGTTHCWCFFTHHFFPSQKICFRYSKSIRTYRTNFPSINFYYLFYLSIKFEHIFRYAKYILQAWRAIIIYMIIMIIE